MVRSDLAGISSLCRMKRRDTWHLFARPHLLVSGRVGEGGARGHGEGQEDWLGWEGGREGWMVLYGALRGGEEVEV